MDISEIRENWYNGVYTYKANIPGSVREGHIFDEELSVRRNRELVKEHNDNVVLLRKNAARIQNELYKRFEYDIVKYIMDNYTLTEAQARKVERFVYQEYHSSMGDYFSNIDIYAEFADSLVHAD